MLSVTQLLFQPVVYIKRSLGGRRKAMSLDAPPPPVDSPNEWAFGPYSWKCIIDACDKEGRVDRSFIGLSQNMNITERTKLACDRHKMPGTKCGEPNLIMKGGECDEVIYMKTKKDGKLINLSNPFFRG
jgi:hypothetical protein